MLAWFTVTVVTAGFGLPFSAPAQTTTIVCSRGEFVHYDEKGTASWYGGDLHGQPTASGEPFDMNALTAAHRTLPFGTRIRVTNLENGRVVVLTVNDRGPAVEDRIVDVSRRAAHDLGFPNSGLAPVRVEALGGC